MSRTSRPTRRPASSSSPSRWVTCRIPRRRDCAPAPPRSSAWSSPRAPTPSLRASCSPSKSAPTSWATTCSWRTRTTSPTARSRASAGCLSRRVDGLFISPVYRLEPEARIYQELQARPRAGRAARSARPVLQQPAERANRGTGRQLHRHATPAQAGPQAHRLSLRPPDAPWALERFEGYRRALREAGSGRG